MSPTVANHAAPAASHASPHAQNAAGTQPAITADSLVKTYQLRGHRNGVRALDGLSITVARGTVFGLLGPNGAGKSTTIKILTTLARPDSGTAAVAGLDVLKRPEQVRRVIGVVAQKSGSDPMATGRENLILQGHLFGMRGEAVKARADELLERFDLAGAAGRLVKTYSGGMQRRLDVALGLVHRPQVLFLDEPTAGLDPEARSAMWREIARLSGGEGMTVLLTTHYMEEAQYLADRVAVIAAGLIVAQGPPASLGARDTARARIRYRLPVGAVPPEGLAGPLGPDGFTELAADDVTLTLHKLTGWAIDQGVSLDGLEVTRPSLEDVYLALTDASSGADGNQPAPQAAGERGSA
jgi:ABC-2 type transport system ATP-binding protein